MNWKHIKFINKSLQIFLRLNEISLNLNPSSAYRWPLGIRKLISSTISSGLLGDKLLHNVTRLTFKIVFHKMIRYSILDTRSPTIRSSAHFPKKLSLDCLLVYSSPLECSSSSFLSDSTSDVKRSKLSLTLQDINS